jgi:hypothetical protein
LEFIYLQYLESIKEYTKHLIDFYHAPDFLRKNDAEDSCTYPYYRITCRGEGDTGYCSTEPPGGAKRRARSEYSTLY